MIEIVGPVLERIGAPAGLVNVVCSEPAPTFTQWIQSPLVNDVIYFGGVQPGLDIERRCSRPDKKPLLELAGNDVVVVWSDETSHGRPRMPCSRRSSGPGRFGSSRTSWWFTRTSPTNSISKVIDKINDSSIRIFPMTTACFFPVLRHDTFYSVLRDAIDQGAHLLLGGSKRPCRRLTV